MSYQPSIVPGGAWRAWLAGELRSIASAINEPEFIKLTELNAEPEKLENGMIVNADGTNWNPGSGAGIYARIAGAWVKL